MEQQNQQSTIPEQIKSKPLIRTFLLVALIAVVFSVGGILLLKAMQPAPVVQVPQPTPSPSPQPQVPEGWQTYRNEEFGFEVRYPSTVTAKDWAGTSYAGGNIELLVHLGRNEDITSPDAVVIQIEKGTSLNDLYTEAGREILFKNLLVNPQEFREVTVGQGSYKAIKAEYDKQLPALERPNEYIHLAFTKYFVDHNGILYQITYYPERDSPVTRDIFSQILSTFRFVEQKGK